MSRRSKYQLSPATVNLLTGFLLVFLAVLVFFADKSYLEFIFSPVFGSGYRWFFSPIIGLVGIRLLLGKNNFDIRRLVGLALFWLGSVTLYGYSQGADSMAAFDIHPIALQYLDTIPTITLCVGLILFSLYLLFHVSYAQLMEHMGRNAKKAYHKQIEVLNSFGPDPRVQKHISKIKTELQQERELDKYKKKSDELQVKIQKLQHDDDSEGSGIMDLATNAIRGAKNLTRMSIPIEDRDAPVVHKPTRKPVGQIQMGLGNLTWEYPRPDLLKNHKKVNPITKVQIELMSAVIERTLLQFRIEVQMHGYEIGPTVIQFRLRPSEGTKLNKIENLKKDLTLALKAKNIRIQAPIPGLGLVGIEVPNDHRQIVSLREVAESQEFLGHPSNLAMCVGKDVSGRCIVTDLKDMPHILIAGQTGSGKSVGMNGFLLSLLMKNSPSELRMIMIDPKRVELSVYNGIPHLLVPVINHPEKALNALKWAVTEMVRRYDVLTEARCRNITEYNERASKKDRLPNIAIVVDELADLMMSMTKKDVENAIARIAQMARAVGMHLIVATQRPSVDVITGLIKANIPSRIAFTVASQVDSRTIIDRIGSEDLLGKGDMLYLPSGAMAPERIQGVYVDITEVETMVHHIKRTIDPAMLEDIYDASIVDGETVAGLDGQPVELGDDEELVQQAIEIVQSTGKASTSLLQRRLKLGYARAARVMDLLEELGVVGPADGSKPRQVL